MAIKFKMMVSSSGIEYIYSCSRCGIVINKYFVPAGNFSCGVDWDSFPESCFCGEILAIKRKVTKLVTMPLISEFIQTTKVLENE